MPTIRPANSGDLHAITDIYNDCVLNSDATFDLQPKSVDQQKAWFDRIRPDLPVLVAEDGDTVVGWGCLYPWSDKEGAARTGGNSLYIHRDHRGRGVGKQMLTALLQAGREAGMHSLIARITDTNSVSLHLHEQAGFTNAGLLREVGWKFGRHLNVILMQYIYPGPPQEDATSSACEERST
ncbi:MAG: N-acetyltransferase family protein [Phycisphaerae bacterium]